MPTRVLVADDSFLIREGLCQMLGLTDRVVVVGSCADEAETLAAVDAEPPDVVLSDVRMPPTGTDEGVRIARRLRVTHPRVGVVLLSQVASPALAAELVRHGAERRGFLVKDRVHDLDQLVDTLVAVAAGECRIDPLLISGLVQPGPNADAELDRLTPRQRELLGDIAEGKSNGAIAQDRYLSQRAVEKHVSEIFSRLGIASDAEINRRVRATLLYLDATRR
jgi:DNA-binding NarL/FixJ family response regulator